jgi:hypothetical protein
MTTVHDWTVPSASNISSSAATPVFRARLRTRSFIGVCDLLFAQVVFMAAMEVNSSAVQPSTSTEYLSAGV